ncbi:MAG: hypothetical protein HUJ91_03585, partial [Bacteroidales bacterium]|nr:hypothetical protein [Bacteroidales bacterium]
MMRGARRHIIIAMMVFIASTTFAWGQFTRNTAISSGPPGANMGSETTSDTEAESDTLQGFSLKHLYRGLLRKEPLTPGYAAFG